MYERNFLNVAANSFTIRMIIISWIWALPESRLGFISVVSSFKISVSVRRFSLRQGKSIGKIVLFFIHERCLAMREFCDSQ